MASIARIGSRAMRARAWLVFLFAVLPCLAVVSPAAAADSPPPKGETVGREGLSESKNDPTNPTLQVRVSQPGVDPSELHLHVISSSKPSVVTPEDVTFEGDGELRTVRVNSPGVAGITELIVEVTGAEGLSSTFMFRYALSNLQPESSTTRWLYGLSDASTVQDVGDGYILVGDDESNAIALYKDEVSGYPIKTWDFTGDMSGFYFSAATPEEIDIEASARAGNTIYWSGSEGNSKKGNLKPERNIVFTTTVTGSGADTELTYDGLYDLLRNDFIEWDNENGARFGFAADSAAGKIPKELSGYNLEGIEFAPGSEDEAYVGFRTPLDPPTLSGKAIVVPVKNFGELSDHGINTTVHAEFGEPMLWDLGGLGVREIRKNAANEYLIIAGSYKGGGRYVLYRWDGNPAHEPVRTDTFLPAPDGNGEDPGAWESIVSVPEPIEQGAPVRLVMDNGSTDFYDWGAEAKLTFPWSQKERTDVFPLQLTPLPPAVPTHLTAAPGTGTHFELAWQAPEDEGGEPIERYEVTPIDDGVEGSPIVTPDASTSYSVSGLNPGDTYSFKVAAVNDVGAGPATAATAATRLPTVPTAPENVTVDGVDDRQATVSWTAPVDAGGEPIEGYVITPYIGGVPQPTFSTGSTETTATVRPLDNGSIYTFTVAAVNARGTGVASAPSWAVRLPGVPPAPTAVHAVVAGNHAATVSWTAPTDDGGEAIEHYVVVPRLDGVPQPLVATTDASTSVTVTGLTDGASYTFTVAAVNAKGGGPESASDAFTMPTFAPAAPTAVTATPGDGAATVSWVAPSDSGGAVITGYRVTPFREGVAQAPVTTPTAATSFTVTGLTQGARYTFAVAAINAVGAGGDSGQSAAVQLPAVPGAPTAVQVTPGDGKAMIVWTAPADDGGAPITSYVITPYVAGVAQAPVDTGSPVAGFRLGGLIDGTTYTFTVAAVNAEGTGAASAPSAAVQLPMASSPASTQSAAPGGGQQSAAPAVPKPRTGRTGKPAEPSLSQVKVSPKGALTLRLSGAAKVTVTVERRSGGRWAKVATISRQAAAGPVSIPLKQLKRSGSYRVTVVAGGRGGQSRPLTRSVTVRS